MATKEDEKAEAAPAAEAPKKERPQKPKGDKKKATEPAGPPPKYKREKPPRLRAMYDGTVRGTMMKEFNYATVMQVPRVVKITVNMGLGKAKDEPKMIDNAIEELKQITGKTSPCSSCARARRSA
jgi:large subunit ribosomal protein L5